LGALTTNETFPLPFVRTFVAPVAPVALTFDARWSLVARLTFGIALALGFEPGFELGFALGFELGLG
jgi:hypothetical protein